MNTRGGKVKNSKVGISAPRQADMDAEIRLMSTEPSPDSVVEIRDVSKYMCISSL